VKPVVFNMRQSGPGTRYGWARVTLNRHGWPLHTDPVARAFFAEGAGVARLAQRHGVKKNVIESILRWYLQPENAKALQEARGR
jgi:hypothetical protein